MELSIGTATQYTESLKKMLPLGAYWDKVKSDSESDVCLICSGMGNDIKEFRGRMSQALREAYPATADETLDCWERIRLGTVNSGLPKENRRALILGNNGFMSIYKIAESFGVEISCTFPFKCGFFGRMKFGHSRLGAQNTLSVIEISVSGGENLDETENFESAIRDHLVANLIAYFKYVTDGKSFVSMAELARTVKIDITPKHVYTPARFGRAYFGNTRIAAPYMADVAFVVMHGYGASWKRRDVEKAVLETAEKFEKICFVYGKESFYGGCKASAYGHTFESLKELSEHTGVMISETKPYKAARFGVSHFGTTRIAPPEAELVTFITIHGYGADFRRSDIETAAFKLQKKYITVYYVYGKEVIYGGHVS